MFRKEAIMKFIDDIEADFIDNTLNDEQRRKRARALHRWINKYIRQPKPKKKLVITIKPRGNK